jgi:anaerobic selenocysteine-containing dehydrogenase
VTDDRAADIWGARTPYAAGAQWPARVDEFLAEPEVDRWVRGACLLCSNGCGLEVAVRDGRMVGVRGRAEDRINTAGWARRACTAGRDSSTTA